MVKRFKDCEREAGIDSIGEEPALQYSWFAYKGGKSFGPFTDRGTASAISLMVERVADSESRKAYDDYWETKKKVKRHAYDLWLESLRDEYKNMPHARFKIIYDEAYEQSHSYGHDAVAEKFETLAMFAEEILKTVE